MNTTPADIKHAFSDEERRGVYRAIHERHDMRRVSGAPLAMAQIAALEGEADA